MNKNNALVTYHSNGRVKCIQHSIFNGQLHREDGPAVTVFYENGQKHSEEYYINGVLHRDEGPSRIQWFQNGATHSVSYYKNGSRHRLGEPAFEGFYEDGQKHEESWFVNGVQHREDGPAYTKWTRSDTVQYEYYCFHGETFSCKDWKEKVKPKPETVEITVEINGKKLSVDSAIELLKSLQN